MSRPSKKRTPFQGLKPPHVGAMLKKNKVEKRIYQSAWARAQGMKDSTIVGFYKKPTMQISTLFDICQILKTNFFVEIADALPAEFPPHKTNPLQAEMNELKKENEKLNIEVAMLKEILGMKK